MRKARRFLHLLVPGIGVALVIGAVVLADSLAIQLFLVVGGLLLTVAGIRRFAEPLLPDDRKYLALRAETEHFMTLVRQLNTVSVEMESDPRGSPRFALEEVRMEIHRSIERMAEFAGKTADEADPDRAGATGAGFERGDG